MTECIIAGTVVKFPFEPYDVQRDYMEKVIMCLRDRTNGALESPSGTGKTLSLLCSSLAWLLAKKEEIKSKMKNVIGHDVDNRNEIDEDQDLQVPKIIYASRTHSQLAQAVKELKRSPYSAVKAVVLGSRDQLCLLPEVKKEPESVHKIQMCKFLVQSQKCSYKGQIESNHTDFCGSSIMDIEDLVTAGQTHKKCPYYAANELANEADIIFMPYQYLFDPSGRQENQIQMSNAIFILDEAHNIEKVCDESASGHIKSSDLVMAIEDSDQIIKLMNEGKIEVKNTDSDIEVDDVVSLKEKLSKLKIAIDQIQVNDDLTTFPASYIFELLEKANITFSSSKGILQLLDKLVQLMVLESQRNSSSFLKVGNLLSCVFNCDESDMAKVERSFKIHVQFVESYMPYGLMTKILNYLCFNPGFGMEKLHNLNPRSVILTSSTLSPLEPLIAELNLTVSQRLENPHIVNASQVFCKIVGYGPDGATLTSEYANRYNPNYINSLGSTILNVARIVPDGLLVFFPSYALLHQFVNFWEDSGKLADIFRSKPIFIEPKGNDDLVKTMNLFNESIEDSKGACFMAVCRGKMSEGLDFIDRKCRAVIMACLPFPPLKDPKIILKKQYLDENRTNENGLLTGADWYTLQAMRTVNLAIGRVIRHREDYGAILLCDSRFEQSHQIQQLSNWIRDSLGSNPTSSEFTSVEEELRDFFNNIETSRDEPDNNRVITEAEEQSSSRICVHEDTISPSASSQLLYSNAQTQNDVAENSLILIDDEDEEQSSSRICAYEDTISPSASSQLSYSNAQTQKNVSDNSLILIDDDQEHAISCRPVSVLTARQSGHMELSSVMDNSSILPSCSGSSSSSSASVKMNKREQQESKCAPLSDEREAINPKKIRVEENTIFPTPPSSQLSYINTQTTKK